MRPTVKPSKLDTDSKDCISSFAFVRPKKASKSLLHNVSLFSLMSSSLHSFWRTRTRPSIKLKLKYKSVLRSSRQKCCSACFMSDFKSKLVTVLLLHCLTTINLTLAVPSSLTRPFHEPLNYCENGNETLSLNEFRVHLSQFNNDDSSLCTICTCTKRARMDCKHLSFKGESLNAKPLCDVRPLSTPERECCQQYQAKKLDAMTEERTKTDIRMVAENHGDCFQNGQVYANGQKFWPKLSQKDDVRSCIQCHCRDNAVYCATQDCCQVNQTPDEHNCCSCSSEPNHSDKKPSIRSIAMQTSFIPTHQAQQTLNAFKVLPLWSDSSPSPASSTSSPASSSSSSPPSSSMNLKLFQIDSNDVTPPNSSKESCYSSGRTYVNGAKWNPELGPFGIIRCVICKCQSGTIQCYRTKISLEQNDERRTVRAVLPKSKHRHPLRTCLPSKSDILVYSKNSYQLSSTNSTFHFAFKHALKRNDPIRICSYTSANHRVIRFSDKLMSLTQYHEEVKRKEYRLIGVTSFDSMNRFIWHLRVMNQRCRIKRCQTNLKNVIQKLNLKRFLLENPDCKLSYDQLREKNAFLNLNS